MRTRQFVGLFVVLALAAPSAFAQKTVVVVTADPTGAASDQVYFDMVGTGTVPVSGGGTVPGLGYNLVILDVATYPQTTFTSADGNLLLILESVGSGNVNDTHADDPIPIVCTEPFLSDERTGRSSFWFNDTNTANAGAGVTAINITNNTHPVTSLWPLGQLTMWPGGPDQGQMTGTFGSGVQILAQGVAPATGTVFAVVDQGATLLTGAPANVSPAPARRAIFSAFATSYQNATIDAVYLFQRLIQWGIGDPVTAGEPAGEGEGEGEGRVTNGLIGWWRFEETSGTTVADSSGRGHDGQLVVFGTGTSPNLNVTGQHGSAIQFGTGSDGNAGFVNVPTHADFDITGDLAIEFWLKVDAAWVSSTGSAAQAIFAHGDQTYQLRHQNNGRIRDGVRNRVFTPPNTYAGGMDALATSGTGTVVADQWQHVVYTIDAGVQKYYFNGVLSATTVINRPITGPTALVTITPDTTDDGIQIGGQFDPLGTPRRPLNGQMDEVAFYNRALSAAEVMQNYLSDPNAGGGEGEPQGNVITSNVYPPFIDVGTVVILTAPAGTGHQWAKDGADISGATDRTLVFNPVALSDEGSYTVTYDDGLKVVQTTPAFILLVSPEGSVPVVGLAGLALLVGAGAIGGMRIVRRRRG